MTASSAKRPSTAPDAGTLTPPASLSPSSARWWSEVVADYDLAAHHLLLLAKACEALDVADEARLILKTTGLVTTDRYGMPKAHPMVAVERDARLSFARLLRELDLDADPVPDPRPPRRGRVR